jgi:predicted dehydrogenase
VAARGERELTEPAREAGAGGGAPLRVGVVGVGALGRHHVRLLTGLDGVELAGIHDLRPEIAESVASEFGTRALPSLDALASLAEAMVVAVPTVSHAEVAGELLDRGLHVLVEKPITPDLESADRLIERAGDRVLAVGHVEFYNPAVQALLALEPRPRFIEVQRLSVFGSRSLDIDVILDLMIHDLQILHTLDPSPVREVRAAGVAVLSDRLDIANARVELESGCVANLTASRVSAERVRKLRLFSRERYFSLDYQEQTLKGYRLEDGGAVASARGDAPAGQAGGAGRRIAALDLSVAREEPLRRELEAFAAACRRRAVAYVDGARGRAALRSALAIAGAVGPRGSA